MNTASETCYRVQLPTKAATEDIAAKPISSENRILSAIEEQRYDKETLGVEESTEVSDTELHVMQEYNATIVKSAELSEAELSDGELLSDMEEDFAEVSGTELSVIQEDNAAIAKILKPLSDEDWI